MPTRHHPVIACQGACSRLESGKIAEKHASLHQSQPRHGAGQSQLSLAHDTIMVGRHGALTAAATAMVRRQVVGNDVALIS
jgi:hypothetical protein